MTQSNTAPQHPPHPAPPSSLAIDWGSALHGAAQVVLPHTNNFESRHRQWVQSVQDRMRRDGLVGDWATQESTTLKAEVRDRIIGQFTCFFSLMGLLVLVLYAGTHWPTAIAVPIACLPLALTWGIQAADRRRLACLSSSATPTSD